jgi:hypothetical protein
MDVVSHDYEALTGAAPRSIRQVIELERERMPLARGRREVRDGASKGG